MTLAHTEERRQQGRKKKCGGVRAGAGRRVREPWRDVLVQSGEMPRAQSGFTMRATPAYKPARQNAGIEGWRFPPRPLKAGHGTRRGSAVASCRHIQRA